MIEFGRLFTWREQREDSRLAHTCEGCNRKERGKLHGKWGEGIRVTMTACVGSRAIE